MAPVLLMLVNYHKGHGKSKKDAKLHASKALLVHLHKVGFDPMTGNIVPGQSDTAGTLVTVTRKLSCFTLKVSASGINY